MIEPTNDREPIKVFEVPGHRVPPMRLPIVDACASSVLLTKCANSTDQRIANA